MCWRNPPLEGPLEPQSIFKSGKYKIKALLQFSEKNWTILFVFNENKIFKLNSWKKNVFNKFVNNLHIYFNQSPRFKSFGSSRNSLNPTFRPNLRLNSDDSLCHVIDSCKIFG